MADDYEHMLAGCVPQAKRKVRVVRVMEYEYDSFDMASEDMARWTMSLKLPYMRMRSTSLPALSIAAEPAEEGT